MSAKNQILEHLEEFTGESNKDTLQGIYAKYRQSALQKTEELAKAMPTGDFTVLYEISHALKGASNIMGHSEMWQHTASFVEGTKTHDISKCEAELEQMRRLASALEE